MLAASSHDTTHTATTSTAVAPVIDRVSTHQPDGPRGGITP